MPNMSLKKNEMPVQDPKIRSGNFEEVALGYTEVQAVDEAERCLFQGHTVRGSGAGIGAFCAAGGGLSLSAHAVAAELFRRGYALCFDQGTAA